MFSANMRLELFIALPLITSLPDEPTSEHIRELLPANVQSCAEYEQLFDKCLDALTRRTRQQGFEDYPRSMGTLVEIEVWRAERNYSAAFSALHQHTRSGCPVCESLRRVVQELCNDIWGNDDEV
jgi:hypothetical protein